jgi:hypothetical protein
MKKEPTPTAHSIWGALAGLFLTAIVLVMTGAISAGVFPLMIEEQLDPFFLGHSISALLLSGAIAGAIIGALSVKSRASKK